MTSLAAAPTARVLADVFPRPAGRVRAVAVNAALVAAGTLLVAGAAQLAVPFWPVPLTMQTFAVLLVGTALGPVRGASALAVYLVIGVLGVPVFSAGTSGSLFALTSGGFILGFVVAAALTGWLARRAWDRRVVGTLVSFAGGSTVMYAFGLPWLFVSLQNLGPAVWQDGLGYDSVLAATFGSGLVPFLLGDVVKAVAAGVLLPATWRAVRALDARR
jgi:biotin transport system substrate-specific component